MSSGPSVAIFGPLGFIGKDIVPSFVDALEAKQISSLTLFSRDSTAAKFKPYRERGVAISEANFEDAAALTQALKGHHAVVSLMGTKGDYKKNKEILIEAGANAGVKLYLPSEYGTDHRNIRWDQPMFTNKQEHHARAEKLGLKVIALYTGLIMEIAFWKALFFNAADRTWNIVGTGDIPFALTSQRDLGPLSLHTVLLASQSPNKVPSNIRLYSDNRSPNQYKQVFESVLGEKLKVNVTPLDQAEKEYEEKKKSIPPGMLGPLIPLLGADGAFDHSKDNERELINPGEKNFKWTTVDEYAREVGGLPWLDRTPF